MNADTEQCVLRYSKTLGGRESVSHPRKRSVYQLPFRNKTIQEPDEDYCRTNAPRRSVEASHRDSIMYNLWYRILLEQIWQTVHEICWIATVRLSRDSVLADHTDGTSRVI